jgi:ElaA protein
MEITVKSFGEMEIHELHDILLLRSEVFVVEQDCVYQDIDGKDQQALHIIGKKDGKVVAYARCFGPEIYFKDAAIGRVVVDLNERKYGYGNDIMKASVVAIKKRYHTKRIKLSAQTYLIKFYESHGFQTTGEAYLEDGIPHIAMVTA